VKTRWMNMLFPMKHVMEQYWPLMAKMRVNVSRNNIVAINLNLFCDLELIIGLHVILPFLDFMHTLVKLTQSCDVFVCEFVDMVKVCQLDLYYFYLIHTPSLMILLLKSQKLLNHSIAKIYQWISMKIWTMKRPIVSSMNFLVLNFLWTSVILQQVLSNLCWS
jgi:hypothetical protein